MLAAGLLALAVAATAPPDIRLGAATLAEIVACLHGDRWSLDARHEPASAADALGLPPKMRLARIADAPGRLFVYEDEGGQVIECGVAVYDPLPQDFIFLVGAAIRTAKPGYETRPADFWRLEPAAPVNVYWGDPRAPGLYGVMLRGGGDGLHAPVLQIDSHSVLVR